MENSIDMQPKINTFKENFNSYVEKIKNNPLDLESIQAQERKLKKDYSFLKLNLRNKRTMDQIEEFVNSGLAKIIPKEEIDRGSYIEYYESSLREGHELQSAPIYGLDEDGKEEIVSYEYAVTPVNPSIEQEVLAEEINNKYELNSKRAFYYDQEAKENLLKQKVSEGTMEFIGEMSFSEYIELRQENKEVNGSNFEMIPSFDENKEWWTDMRKVYAYVNPA